MDRAEDENRLFVGKIPIAIPNEEVERYFGRFGPISHFMSPRPSGSLKIAFVTYQTKQALDIALESSHHLGGSELNVTKALPKTSRGQTPGGDTKKESRIFVGQLPAGTTEEELVSYFSKFGTIARVHFPPQTPEKDKVYCFITFATAQEKFAALATNHIFKGVEIRVVEAMPKGVTDRPRVALASSSYFAPSSGSSSRGPPSAGSAAPTSADFEENPVRLFAGRLPSDATPEEVRDFFTRYGTVVDVFMPGRGKDGKGSPYAFVTFSHTRELFKALADVPHTFKDTKIEVVEAKPKGVPGSSNQPHASAQGEPRVFVGRIPNDVTDAQLRDYFGNFGRIVDVYRPKQHSKDGMDFAFVIFTSQQEVARVLAEEKHIINGKYELNVIRARPRNAPPGPTPPPMVSSAASAWSPREQQGGYGPPIEPAYLPPQQSYDMYTPGPGPNYPGSGPSYPGSGPGYPGYPPPPSAYDPYGGAQGYNAPHSGGPPPFGVPPLQYGSVPSGYGAAPSAVKHQRYAPY